MAVAVPPSPASADDASRAAATKHKRAARLVADGEYTQALALIDDGLTAAPGNLQLLQLRGSALLEMRDFEGALAAYETFLAAGPKGANRRTALRIIANLQSVRTTKLALTIKGAASDDAANVYLDTKTLGVFCTAAPACEKGMLPGEYKLIVERPGHKKLTERVTVELGQTLTLERAMLEEPSPLAVSVTAAAGTSTVVVDGKELGAAPQSVTVEPGEHTLELRTAGHVTERQTIVAQKGKPIEVALTLRRLVPIAVNVSGAEVLIGDAPAPRESDQLALPTGAVTLSVRAKGYRVATVEVPAVRPDDYRVAVELALAPAPLSVKGAPRGAVVTVDGRVAGTVPLAEPIEIDQGDHTVEVTAPQRATFRTRVDVGSDAALELDVAAMPSTRRRWVWIAAAGTGVALASTATFGALALREQSSFDDRAGEAGVTPADPRLMDSSDAGGRYARFADVGMVLTLAGAGTMTWLYLKEGKGQSRGDIGPLLAPGAVGVQGSF
ncbi:MAG TPA: PEGA domain-containing protein [Kofleriaceae bacterium]|nr:PEGA domain-containing protein [Kofleriaceae bacterium]